MIAMAYGPLYPKLMNQAEQLLPPAVPKVTFDLDMTRYISNITFDYHGFYDLVKQYGITDEQVSEHSIHFNASEAPTEITERDDTAVEIGRFVLGNNTSYIHGNDVASQYMRGRLPSERNIALYGLVATQSINSTLMHETGHWVDSLTTQTIQRQIKQNTTRTRVSIIAGIATAVIVMNETDTIYSAAVGPVVPYLGARLAEHRYRKKYPRHEDKPTEQPANQFEKKHSDTKLVHFTYKDRSNLVGAEPAHTYHGLNITDALSWIIR